MLELPLILGGHTYIQQLGNEPRPSPDQIDAIVAACLDAGIVWFDTTYRPERIAVGKSLQRLRRRDEAHLIAWNFFRLFDDGDDVGGPDAYQPHHLDEMLRDLHTDRIDALVVHGVPQADDNKRQTELAVGWQHQGLVGTLGCWSPGVAAAQQAAQTGSPFQFAVEPHNVTTHDSPAKTQAYTQAGWSVFACSPFVRGWELDRLVERATLYEGFQSLPSTTMRSRISDLLIRFSLFSPCVDRLIIAMRRVEWVNAAVQAVQRGPLNEDEQALLNALTMP
jgi:aryl-alcohol dehydrogenase-like predicted oxidoreductase